MIYPRVMPLFTSIRSNTYPYHYYHSMGYIRLSCITVLHCMCIMLTYGIYRVTCVYIYTVCVCVDLSSNGNT